MRINIEVDDALLQRAARLSKLKTKRAVVEAGLLVLVQIKKQEQIRKFRGKLNWTGNLEKMRTDR